MPEPDPGASSRPLERRRIGLRVLAAVLLGLWAGLALAILIAYRPGGPWDLLVAGTAFVPIPIAAVAVVWPPVVKPWRSAAAVAWVGLLAAFVVTPILLLEVRALAAGGHQTLLPSAEVAYAALVALGCLCLFASLGVVSGRRRRDITTRQGMLHAVGVAVLLTAATAIAFGGAAVANDLALREVPVPPSRYGPTDPSVPARTCDSPVALGPSAVLATVASATIDGVVVGSAQIGGVRAGTDERWSGSLGSDFDTAAAGYTRLGAAAWLEMNASRQEPVSPDPFSMLGDDELTLDGPVVAAIAAHPRPVAEDLGTELVEGAKARHCRTAIDGPLALRISLPLRWLAGGRLVVPSHQLDDWRGSLDWWVFTDGQLGQASVTVGGYPGDAWPSSGLQGVISARLTALDRTVPQEVVAPSAPATFSATPEASPDAQAATAPARPRSPAP